MPPGLCPAAPAWLTEQLQQQLCQQVLRLELCGLVHLVESSLLSKGSR